MRTTVLSIFIMAFLLVGFLATPFLTGNVSATNWYTKTALPSAYYSDIVFGIGDGQIDPGATIYYDGLTWLDLYSRYGSTVTVTTGDYSNPVFPYEFGIDSNTTNSEVPLGVGAVIVGIWAVAIFTGIYPSIDDTDLGLAYSLDSSTYHTGPAPYYMELYVHIDVIDGFMVGHSIMGLASNVTGMESWTPEMLNSGDFSARLTMTLPARVPYYLDYLGFVYVWYVAGLPDNPADENPEVNPGNLSIPSVTGIMGIIGGIGMIGVPAFGIWLARTSGEDRLPLFLKISVGFVFCFALFYASIL